MIELHGQITQILLRGSVNVVPSDGSAGEIDTSDATATENDIADGKTAFANGEKITGTVPLQSAMGLDDSSVSSVNIGGQNTLRLTKNIGKRRMLDANAQVELRTPISNLGTATPADVAEGKTFTSAAGLKVTGTRVDLDTSDATATAGDIAHGKTAYVNGEKITGSIASLVNARGEAGVSKSSDGSNGIKITYTGKYRRYIDNGAYLFVNGSDIGDATASDVAAGKTFTSAAGLKATGTMQSKAAATYTPGTSDQTIASGQYLSGAQTIKGDSNLVAGNIKSGVSIFGVAGTYAGSGGSSSGIQAQRITSASETITISGSGTVKVWGYGFKSSQVGGTTYAFVGDGYYFGSYGTPSKTSLTFSISNGKLSGLPAGLTALDVLVTIGVS